ncbi:hypothetical protein T4C_2611 [Trichinella pseudospiralis]|uniref:Uncharacterized protein n=1 Tax=Trichinella pseudospiralis TaxID=6337 RepID=A0A0V1GDM0_TRIPS|nr:hypothetical protein T4C_2611 [Trichinella pseudospiralis]
MKDLTKHYEQHILCLLNCRNERYANLFANCVRRVNNGVSNAMTDKEYS